MKKWYKFIFLDCNSSFIFFKKSYLKEIDLCDILQSVVYTNMEFNLIQDNEELNDVKKVTGKIEMKLMWYFVNLIFKYPCEIFIIRLFNS